MFFIDSGAQGTTEYLVILSVVLIIGLIVVGGLFSQTSFSEMIFNNSSNVAQVVGVSGLGITDAVIGSDQNGLIVIKNSSGEDVIITGVSVDGVDHNYYTTFVSEQQTTFKLQGITGCREEKENHSIKIYYMSIYGLNKVADFQNIMVDCVSIVTPKTSFVEETAQQVSQTNLLTNPGMEDANYNGWTPSITAQKAGECAWSGLVLCIDTSPVYEGTYNVRFSYSPATLSQEIDLLAKGYSTTYLDSSPDINISDNVIGYFNVSDYYRLKVELRDAGRNVITSYNTGILTASGSWTTLNHLFSGYASGLRYIYFERYGDDAEYWGGSYGPVFDGAQVSFVN